jgi:dephospho-CoA kinase
MLRIGLTGGIGSGKSTVAELFAARVVPVIDTDVIAHELTGPGGAAMADISAAFGDIVMEPDGRLDRAAMRRLVFADPQKRKQLEAILHPMIRKQSDARMAAAEARGAAYALLVVPLLIESGTYRQRVDRILVVDCPEELQIARVMARNNMSRDEVDCILQAQATRAQRLAAADDVIENTGSPADLQARVEALHQRYRATPQP